MPPQVKAIIWAQWRILWSKFPRAGFGFWLSLAFTLVWYGMVAAGAAAIAWYLPHIEAIDSLQRTLKNGLFVGFLYWQFIPVALVSGGLTLDLKRLLVYPVPVSQLYGIEVLLRLTTAMEVILVLLGAIIGLARHPLAPWWAPITLVVFGLFNMFLSVGVRDLLGRLLSRKGIREALALCIVLLTALPQLLLRKISPESLKKFDSVFQVWPWPWSLTARCATGDAVQWTAFGCVAWFLLAWWFSYRQFWRSLRFDAAETRAAERTLRPRAGTWIEALFRVPSRLFRDPLGVLIEKEVRSLARSPRFRLLFFMGFTFGLIIWLPIIFDRSSQQGFIADNFLVMVTMYSALLLGETLFWNSFGFDRQAAQAYFVMPVKMTTVLIAKNSVALFFLVLEVAAICTVCALLNLGLTWTKIAESIAVTLLFGLLLVAVGNLASVRYPKASNPVQAWRNSSNAKTGLIMFLLYPIFAAPTALAYLARYAFESELAFVAVLAISFILACAIYWVALESASARAEQMKEPMLASLSQGEGLLT